MYLKLQLYLTSQYLTQRTLYIYIYIYIYIHTLATLLSTPVQLLGNTNCTITWQQLNAFRHPDVVKTTC